MILLSRILSRLGFAIGIVAIFFAIFFISVDTAHIVLFLGSIWCLTMGIAIRVYKEDTF